MSGWRHVERRDVDGSCRVTVGFDQYTDSCSCLTPTPDPASPCGYLLPDDDLLGIERPCGWPERAVVHDRHHPHQPTRCTCGHQIERNP